MFVLTFLFGYLLFLRVQFLKVCVLSAKNSLASVRVCFVLTAKTKCPTGLAGGFRVTRDILPLAPKPGSLVQPNHWYEAEENRR